MQGKPNEKMFEGFNETIETLFDDEEVEKMVGEKYPEEDETVINGRQT